MHKNRLFSLYRNFDTNIRNVETFEKMINFEFMEGGFNTEQFYLQTNTALNTAASVLNFAMMLEVQAMDLYMRYAAKSEDPQVKDILYKMADEEKAHLKRLADLIEKTANNF